MDEYNVTIVNVSGFAFLLPELPEETAVEVTVQYHSDIDDVIHSEAWIRSSKRKTVCFLADITEIKERGLTQDEIENRLLGYYNNSEVFAASVTALLNADFKYFDIIEE